MPDLSDAAHPYEGLARAALLEITPAATIGDFVGTTDEGDGVTSLLFASTQPGYPDWLWTVSVVQVDGAQPTVLEAELMPAEGALLAPDWVPWSDRLAEYKAAQAQAGDAEADDDESESDDDDSDDDESDDDDDDLGMDVLHGGDLDGVDIDEPELEETDDDESDDDEESDDEEVDRTY